MTELFKSRNNFHSSTPGSSEENQHHDEPFTSGQTVTRKDLASAICKSSGLPRADALAIAAAVLTTMSEAIIRGEQVKISNFGIFNTHQKGARIGRNPNTMEEAVIPARTVVLFKASPKLRTATNQRKA
jgi:integration host factor subunit alpha